jgi:Concanavalin A-like lectin/glucanases superfamily
VTSSVPVLAIGAIADQGALGPSDPNFSSVVQLAHFDGANGSTTMTNSCPRGSTMLATGTGALSTAQFKFGSASLRCGGSTSGAAESTGNTDYQFGTGDFTIEYWFRPDSIAAAQNVVFFNGGAQDGFFFNTNGSFVYFAANATKITSAISLIAAATWVFIAYSRIGTSGVLYVNGTNQGSWTDNRNYSSDLLLCGRTTGNANSLVGYIDDVRVTKGVGRYSGSTCPVPSAAFPNH